MVKVHRDGYSCLVESYFDEFLLLGWKEDVATSALEVLVASELSDEYCHELVVLVGIHSLLEVGESFGKAYWIAVAIVGTVGLLGAF